MAQGLVPRVIHARVGLRYPVRDPARTFLDGRHRGIAGRSVNDDDLDVRVVLVQDAIQGPADGRCGVPHRDDDRDAGRGRSLGSHQRADQRTRRPIRISLMVVVRVRTCGEMIEPA